MKPDRWEHRMGDLNENRAQPVFVAPHFRTHYLKLTAFRKADQCTFQA